VETRRIRASRRPRLSDQLEERVRVLTLAPQEVVEGPPHEACLGFWPHDLPTTASTRARTCLATLARTVS